MKATMTYMDPLEYIMYIDKYSFNEHTPTERIYFQHLFHPTYDKNTNPAGSLTIDPYVYPPWN